MLLLSELSLSRSSRQGDDAVAKIVLDVCASRSKICWKLLNTSCVYLVSYMISLARSSGKSDDALVKTVLDVCTSRSKICWKRLNTLCICLGLFMMLHVSTRIRCILWQYDNLSSMIGVYSSENCSRDNTHCWFHLIRRTSLKIQCVFESYIKSS